MVTVGGKRSSGAHGAQSAEPATDNKRQKPSLPRKIVSRVQEVDEALVQLLLANWERIPDRYFTNYKYNDEEVVASRKEQKAYLQSVEKKLKNNRLTVSFGPTSENGSGRMYCKGGGYQGMRGSIRATLARQFYVDLDIANCQPSIMAQLCAKHGIPTPKLQDYISNRSEYIDLYINRANCSKKEAKAASCRCSSAVAKRHSSKARTTTNSVSSGRRCKMPRRRCWYSSSRWTTASRRLSCRPSARSPASVQRIQPRRRQTALTTTKAFDTSS